MFSLNTKIFFISLMVACAVSACGGSDDDAAKSATVPAAIKEVDDALAKPYEEYFNNSQSDFSMAYQIGGKVQKVIDQSDQRSLPHVMGLVETASQLEKNPSEENYTALVNEWKGVRSKIKLRQ